MAGSPLKRARRTPVSLADGTVIAFSLLNRPRAGLTHGQWRMLSPAERIERQLGSMGLSLDQCCEIVSWPWAFGDPARMAIQIQVLSVILGLAGKAMLDGTLERQTAGEKTEQD
jgi:hypothetical protein